MTGRRQTWPTKRNSGLDPQTEKAFSRKNLNNVCSFKDKTIPGLHCLLNSDSVCLENLYFTFKAQQGLWWPSNSGITEKAWEIPMARPPQVTGTSDPKWQLVKLCLMTAGKWVSVRGGTEPRGVPVLPRFPWRNDVSNVIAIFWVSVYYGYGLRLHALLERKTKTIKGFYNLSYCPLTWLNAASLRAGQVEFSRISASDWHSRDNIAPLQPSRNRLQARFWRRSFPHRSGLRPRCYTKGTHNSEMISSQSWNNI